MLGNQQSQPATGGWKDRRIQDAYYLLADALRSMQVDISNHPLLNEIELLDEHGPSAT